MLPAHDAEIREKAMQAQMEADCGAACGFCQHGVPAVLHPTKSAFGAAQWAHKDSDGVWRYLCSASTIREAFAKAEQERKGGAA